MILVVCKSNVGRSQMLEGYLNHLAGERIAYSAGVDTEGMVEKYDGHPALEVIALMKEESINIAAHSITQLTSAMIEKVKIVIVLCEQGICPDYLQSFPNVFFSPVPDPYKHGIEELRKVRDCLKLLATDILVGRKEFYHEN